MIQPGLLQDWVGPEPEGGFDLPRPIGVVMLELVSSLHKRQRTGHHSHSALYVVPDVDYLLIAYSLIAYTY